MSNRGRTVCDVVTAAAWVALAVALVIRPARDEAERLEGAFWTGFGRAYFGLEPRK